MNSLERFRVEQLASLLPLVGILLIFWLLVIRPAQRRNRELARLQGSLGPGDRVMLASGFYATIHGVEDDRLRVELAEGVVVEVARGAVSRIVEPAAAPAQDEES